MHGEPGDAEGGVSLRTEWMPAPTASLLSSQADGKNDVA